MKKILYFLLCAVLFSCSDEVINPVVRPVITEETLLERGSDIYDIDVPGNSDWTVISNPYWAAPMEFGGKAGTAIELFVETNDADAARRDSLVVELADGGTICIPIRQHGLATAGVNDDGITISANALKRTKGVGYGVNVIEKATDVGMKYNVKSSPFNLSNLKQVINAMGWVDAIIEEDVYSSRYESMTGNTTGAIANQLAVNAGIEVGIKAFKFGVEAGYSKASDNSKKTSYAMLEMQHIVGSRYFRAGLMRYLAEHEEKYSNYITVKDTIKPSIFASTFVENVDKLKKNPGDISAMKVLIDRYGTHVIYHGTLGGELKVSMQMEEENSNESSKIHAALSLSSKLISGDASVELSGDEESAQQNTRLSLRSYGGKNEFTLDPNSTFASFANEVRNKTKMDKWVSLILNKTSLALIDMETIPIWDLMPTEELRDSLRHYVVGPYQRSMYGDDFKPDLYEVNGYDVTTNFPGYGSVYIPEIDMQIVFERTIIKELDTNELSTVVYSGTKDNVNRDRGFFVGSTTRKPCKFHREKNGKFTTEEFDRLTKTAISELYVDVTGDITIAPKVNDDMYVTCSVNNWKYDISVLTSDWTFEENFTVTGTTDHCIHIADSTMLTLDNVTINNQIVCDGNASIVLADGTTNTITQGIVNGPEGTTLTIGGAGSLTATGKSDYPGIGNGKGNIVINGGTVEATGGDRAAGIGSGKKGVCGDITITKGVKAVKATCGTGDTCVPIGAGDDGTCGTVTIESGARVEEVNPNIVDISNIDSPFFVNRDMRITGTTDQLIQLESTCKLTLANVTINNKIECLGGGQIILLDNTTNKVGGGISSLGTVLQISGNGSLFVSAPERTPAISGLDIFIMGGNIEAKGGSEAAAIGSHYRGNCNRIVISGGTVKAFGGQGGAGIGSGMRGTCGDIKIMSGTVVAVGGSSGGAGIGSGNDATCGVISISGGDVTASTEVNAAAIGTGTSGHGKDIIITGGSIDAKCGANGPGIGYGVDTQDDCGNITISGGSVRAIGGANGAGIGSGALSNCKDITIKKTVKEVYAKKGGSKAQSIGAGREASCGHVTIEEGANVTQE